MKLRYINFKFNHAEKYSRNIETFIRKNIHIKHLSHMN